MFYAVVFGVILLNTITKMTITMITTYLPTPTILQIIKEASAPQANLEVEFEIWSTLLNARLPLLVQSRKKKTGLEGIRIQLLNETTVIDIVHWSNTNTNHSSSKDDFHREAALARYLGLPDPNQNEGLRMKTVPSRLIQGGTSTVMDQDYYLFRQLVPVSAFYSVFL